ncbi:MAG: FecR family protein [Bacteroidales bacterium]
MKQPQEFEKLLADYFAGSLSEEDHLRLNEWLNSSDENKKWFDSISKPENAKNLADLYELKHPYQWEKMTAKVKRLKQQQFIRRLSGVAAAVLLPLALIVGVYQFSNKPKMQVAENGAIKPGERKAVLVLSSGEKINLGRNPAQLFEEDGSELSVSTNTGLIYSTQHKSVKTFYNTLDVPVGGEYLLQLSDGTKIWMNSSSKLIYPAIFPENKREVWLEGEAYFEVAHNPESPFIVKTKYFSTTVLGTSFNISVYDDDMEASVTLVTGSVRVNPKGASENILSPEHRLIYSKETKSTVVEKVETEVYTAWKDGVFYFDSETLGSIMKKASRWYNAKVIFESDEVRDMVFYGRLKRYENIDKLLNIMKLTNKIDYTINGNLVRIYKVSN